MAMAPEQIDVLLRPRRVVGTKAFEVPERTVTGIHERLQLKVTFDEVTHPAGRVLFTKKLESFDLLARKAPRVIVYEGTNKLKTKLDKPGTRGYAVDFQGLVEFIHSVEADKIKLADPEQTSLRYRSYVPFRA